MNLADTLYLPRAGRYQNPQNTNDRLPIVYGDLTDGTEGVWRLPCIDTLNFVFGFAAHPVLSAAAGNSISVYADGDPVDPGDYVFSHANDYEGKGAIATVTFNAAPGVRAITARGKGKDDSGTLVENVIDQIVDFLAVECGFDSELIEDTARCTARSKFEGQNYKAAGVIAEDREIWETVTQMIGSFLGSAYLNGTGKLAFSIDDGSLS